MCNPHPVFAIVAAIVALDASVTTKSVSLPPLCIAAYCLQPAYAASTCHAGHHASSADDAPFQGLMLRYHSYHQQATSHDQ
jgi:hypothetical protein